MEKEKAAASKPDKSSTDSRSARASIDARIDELDQEWLDQLGALLMARTLDRSQEPTFQTIKVAPTHFPPAGAVRTTDPVIKPADPPLLQSTDRPTSSDLLNRPPCSPSNSLPANLTLTNLRKWTDQGTLS